MTETKNPGFKLREKARANSGPKGTTGVIQTQDVSNSIWNQYRLSMQTFFLQKVKLHLYLVCFGISIFCRIIPILASISFPLFPFGYLLSLLRWRRRRKKKRKNCFALYHQGMACKFQYKNCLSKINTNYKSSPAD